MKHFVVTVINTKFLTLLFVFNISLFFSQSNTKGTKFYYSLSFQSDSLNKDSRTSHVFVLLNKNNISLFTEVPNREADSLEAKIWQEYKVSNSGTIQFKGLPNAKFKYYLQKDFSNNDVKIDYYDKIGSKNFHYQEIIDYKWNLLNNKKEIGGILCQKATTKVFGRHFTAWFAPSIPINDGPYKFFGLPGLIIEVYDEDEYFKFSLIRYLKNDTISEMEIPNRRLSKLVNTDKEKFNKAKSEYRLGTVARLRSSILAREIAEERYRQIERDIKKNNNFIEKKNR